MDANVTVVEAKQMDFNLQEGQTIYRCERCGGVYKSQGSGARIGCLVLHGPNDCCHLGEEVIEPAKYRIERVPLDKVLR